MVNKKIANLGKFIALFVMAGTIQVRAYYIDSPDQDYFSDQDYLDYFSDQRIIGELPKGIHEKLKETETSEERIDEIKKIVEDINNYYSLYNQEQIIKWTESLNPEMIQTINAEDALKNLRDMANEIAEKLDSSERERIDEPISEILKENGLPFGIRPVEKVQWPPLNPGNIESPFGTSFSENN